MNVDANTDISNGITSLGAIKRNSKGDFMAASARKKSFLGDVEITDAEVVLQCIKLATDSDFSPLIVESDSANVVLVAKIVYRYATSMAHFEWVPHSECGKSCEVWILLHENFESVYLCT